MGVVTLIIQKPTVIPSYHIFDGLVQINAAHVTDACLILDAIDHMELTDWQKGKKCPDYKTNT